MPGNPLHGATLRLAAALLCRLVAALFLGLALAEPASAEPVLKQFIGNAVPSELVPGADSFGPLDSERAVAPALKDGKTVGWVFLTSDFVPTTGYSGKPIHILVGISPDAVITDVRLVKHSEPIVLVSIPEAKIKAVTEHYAGLDLKAEASGEKEHDVDIVSGATVTVMVIDDSIIRAGIKAARALDLPGFAAAAPAGPAREIDREAGSLVDWETLAGSGALRRLRIDVAQVNTDFAALGDPRTSKNAELPPDKAAVVDVWTALVSQPAIGRSLLGEAAYANLAKRMKPGDEAILLLGAGRWSFKGSGYVRGGIFDRFQLIQGEISERFRDRDHSRVVTLAAEGAPEFLEKDLFIIPAGTGFDPAAPWRLQLLVARRVGPIEKLYLTYELGYELPESYTRVVEAPAAAPEPAAPAAGDEVAGERAEHAALWARIWQVQKLEVIVTAAALAFLSVLFFFQIFATRSERLFSTVRTCFLVFTLVFLGWYANAQLSVVNLLAVLSAMFSEFRWETFLMDPLIFVLWFSTAAALLFWGRGAYCGWLCPFGALQELSNKIARRLRVPQVTLPWGLHERLWALKYMIFLALFGASLYSLEAAERLAEVEPFKTAIILKFDRPWPYVLFALAMLAPGLFIERFYCRYVCPLGGGLAIPARLHMFRWLRRYRECGNPCQLCANECPVDAIHPTGEINPNECISCLHCQVLYQHKQKCPVVILREKRRARVGTVSGTEQPGAAKAVKRQGAGTPAPKPQPAKG